MKILLLITLLVSFNKSIAQDSIDNNSKAESHIKMYYSDFQTGYNSNGKFKIFSNNYKASFSGSVFTLTFDSFDENEKPLNQTKTIHLKDVVSIEPYGTDIVEIHGDESFMLPINGKLAFFTKKEMVEIPIYYEVDEDVTTTEIYKAFEKVLKSKKKNKSH